MRKTASFKSMVLMVIAGAIALCFCLTGLACTKNVGLPNAPNPLIAATATPTLSNTPTVVLRLTDTPTASASATPTATIVNTLTFPPTATVSSTKTNSPTATASLTPTTAGANTATPTPTLTNTPSATPSATATLTGTYTPANTPTPIGTALGAAPSLNLPSGSLTLNTGLYYYSCVNIGTGACVTINGAVTIFTECFTLSNGATITGTGTGFSPSMQCGSSPVGGPGAGQDTGNGTCDALCSGGGHGGAGGTACYPNAQAYGGQCCANGGALANDDPVHPALMGSSGAWPGSYTGGCVSTASWGGGLLEVVVYNPASNTLQPATVNGAIYMNGSSASVQDMNGAPSGEGAGGTIWLEASTLSGSGLLVANGGNGAGLGGGGGIISLITNKTAFTGSSLVLGGSGAQNGIVSTNAPPTSGY